LLDRCPGGRERLGVPRYQRHVRSFGRQGFRYREPDPPAAAGDDRPLANKLKIHIAILSPGPPGRSRDPPAARVSLAVTVVLG
jgi:hypothetical protein